VSLDETIRQRTLLYLLMVVVSAALFVGAVYLGRRLALRMGPWNATLAAAGSYIVVIAVVMMSSRRLRSIITRVPIVTRIGIPTAVGGRIVK